jgi:hypothetical protein
VSPLATKSWNLDEKRIFQHFSVEAALVQHRLQFFTEIKPKNFPNGMFNECSCCLGFLMTLKSVLDQLLTKQPEKLRLVQSVCLAEKMLILAHSCFFKNR